MIDAMTGTETGIGDTGRDPRAEKSEAGGEMRGIGGVVDEVEMSGMRNAVGDGLRIEMVIEGEEGERRGVGGEIEVSTCKCLDLSA